MDRRKFLAQAGLAATWAGIAIRISGCSDYNGPTGPGDGDGGGGTGDVTGTVTGAGHSHGGAVVTEAQLADGSAVTLTLTGTHTHTVRLTGQDVLNIAAGMTVARPTEPDMTGHVHTVTFN